jgi:hypothetical protein
MRVRTVGLATLAAFMLSGCYEDTSVIIHEPGVYKGSTDPIVDRPRTAEEQEALRKRLSDGQGQR